MNVLKFANGIRQKVTTKLFGREQELVGKFRNWTIVRTVREDQPLRIV